MLFDGSGHRHRDGWRPILGHILAICDQPVQNGPMIVELSSRTRASRSRQTRTKWPMVIAVLVVLAFVVGMAWIAVQAH